MSPPAHAPRTKQQVLDCEYLPLRAKILEVAAALDRVDRGAGGLDDPRRNQVCEALELLLAESSGRAEQVQLLFSRDYAANWRSEFQL